jgi:glycosyltransferase involved in cell wall biosynthesis
MRIAQCLEYPIQQHGGTEVLVRELIAGLGQHEIVLVSDDDAESWRASAVGGLIREHIRWQPQGATQQNSRALAATLRDKGVALAHFHFGGTFGWGSRRPRFAPSIHLHRLGVPCVATNHGVFGLLDGYIGAQRSMAAKLACWPAAWASRVQLTASLQAEVAVSQNDFHALRRRFWPVRGKFRQIYHSRIHERDPVPALTRRKVILCAGTIGARKAQPHLAHAFAQVAAGFPDWRLVFIGRPGDERTATELQAVMARPELRGRIEWLGACSDAELGHWFQTVEIFAMPSLHEGLGLSLQEALYYGCACIATRIGGIPDLIQDGDNGMLVPVADVPALAHGLAQLMEHDALRAHLRSRAHVSVIEKQMTAERMVAHYETLYREVTQQK